LGSLRRKDSDGRFWVSGLLMAMGTFRLKWVWKLPKIILRHYPNLRKSKQFRTALTLKSAPNQT